MYIESTQIPILELVKCLWPCNLVYSSYCVSINAGVKPNPEMFAAIFPPKRNPPVGFLARCSHGVFLDLAGLRPVRIAYYILTGSAAHHHGRRANQTMRPTFVLALDIYLRFL